MIRVTAGVAAAGHRGVDLAGLGVLARERRTGTASYCEFFKLLIHTVASKAGGTA
ncbi:MULTISPECIES: hypothetical protein [unclassified Streptomyces]|uniref:hypothetical protein n=1 Tax=unclassified Streptomyces TaxID=2593676 RepID=UPI0026802219